MLAVFEGWVPSRVPMRPPAPPPPRRLLVAAGASLAVVNKAGHSPMDAARQGGSGAVEDCLLDASL